MTKPLACPSWLSFYLDNLIRKKIHNPDTTLSDFIRPGYTLLDLGCGPGFFTIPMARMAGNFGKVIAVDIQEKMLSKMLKKAARYNLTDRIIPIHCTAVDISVHDSVDFVLTFWMVHEVENKKSFFNQIAAVMKKVSRYLLVEPKFHVTLREYQKIVRVAEGSGLKPLNTILVPFSRATLFSL